MLYGMIPQDALKEALLMSFSGEESEDEVYARIKSIITSLNKRAT